MVVTESPDLGMVVVDCEVDVDSFMSPDALAPLATTEDDVALFMVGGPSST